MSNDNKFYSFGRVSVQSSLFVNGEINVQNGRLTVGTNSSDASIVAQGSGSMIVPVGTTAERPAEPTAGMVRFNSTTNAIESWNPVRREWTSTVTASSSEYNVDTVKFDLTDEQLTDFDAIEAAFDSPSDVLPANAIYRSTWDLRTTPGTDTIWTSVVWAYRLSGPPVNRYVAVGFSVPGPQVMYSDNGTTWTGVNSLNQVWTSVTYSPTLGRLVAVASSGTGNRVMTSDDNAVTWTSRNSAADNNWNSVIWVPELDLFVAVAGSGSGNRVMTSVDGIVWVLRSSAADNLWTSVTWSSSLSLLVAVASSGTGNRVMVSSDGISWQTKPSAADNNWSSVTWSAELGMFVAVADSGNGNRIMTSYDGNSWTTRPSPRVNGFDLSWRQVVWASSLGLFVAVATASDRFMYSANGINWYLGLAAAPKEWTSLTYNNVSRLFVAVSGDGSPQQAMTTTFATGGKWGGGCLSKNNEIYYIPSNAYNVLVFDPINKDTRIIDLTPTIDPSFNVTNKWIGGCMTPTDVVVAAPFTSRSILTIDATNDAIALFPVDPSIIADSTAQNSFWNTCTTTPANKLVYFAPGKSNRVLTFNYETQAIDSIPIPDLPVPPLDILKYNAIVVGADRNVYLFPRDLPPGDPPIGRILKINVLTNTITAQSVEFPLNQNGTRANMYYGGVLGPDRKIYVMPLANRNILEYDPVTGIVIFHELPLSPLVNFVGVNNWVNAILGQNGKVYGIPFSGRVILEFDPITKVANYIPLPDASRYTGTAFFGAVMGPDNSLYFVPRDANVITEMSFIRNNFYKSWMLSPYYNRS